MVRSKTRILIIDDEEVVLDSCVDILYGEDCQVATTMDGTRGLTLVQEFRPDLVFVDLKMPGISGFEVLEEINRVDPTIVPIVITGYATIPGAVDAIKKGAYDFLVKPFTPDEFRLATRRAMEKRQLVLETLALKREREMLREHFAVIVSHELKSPLGAIKQNLMGLVEELSGVLTEDQQRRLDRMRSRLDDLIELIHVWLRVISVDITTIRDSFHPVSVKTCITKAIETTRPYATGKDIDIVVSVDEPMRSVEGDEGTLTEALVNIIGNAVTYSPVRRTVRVTAGEEADRIVISVSDEGIGIPEEDIPFVFDDFYRARAGAPEEKGSGLGLAISRRIVEAHDGSISVESALGKGSTFLINLPIFASIDDAEGMAGADGVPSSEGGGQV